MRLIVDGSNVMGARPDGWWRDRPAARRRLVREIDAAADTIEAGLAVAGPPVVVFDGRPHELPATVADVRFAPSADDAIAALAGPDDLIVTSDRELVGRVGDRGARAVGVRTLLRLL
ncbi:RNA-binding protein [Patulibacter defluvii]|uniref:RNA-binding protein n=1 Tax=Patulibacter defluvii TaxID=3095358 RepID=UPI002A7537FF|nr:RNA-binding protein [Patulibacter sp. DM4]